MNTPNKLTLARVVMTPFFLGFLLCDLPHHWLIATAIFLLASVTDAIDGKLARKNNQVTTFGQLLDPLADKMLTTAALLAFIHLDLCGVWPVFLILTREFAVTSMRLIAAAQGVVIPANIFGKIKTATQMVFTGMILFWGELVETFGFLKLNFAQVSNGMIWITAVLAVVSGGIYICKAKKVIDFTM
ncbi:MAG TPA: CDP-diacylglycerol--glycerol-3-phosphate 3-phosphatidyltransferase [Ruminococcaceae bacterium]|nr:CDP-diacylglycerol--glycerol-3-phosphate 3-phosphatidyltransferase [Oscillospiraceae bacterium]